MTVEYLASSAVDVFPLAKFRTTTNPTNRLFTEARVANIIDSVVDKPFYVIGEVEESGNTYVEFVIEGYYFKINKSGFSNISNIFVGLDFENGELKGDNNSLFEGLKYSTSIDTDNCPYQLYANGDIPDTAYQKISTKSLIVDTDNIWIIDGTSSNS